MPGPTRQRLPILGKSSQTTKKRSEANGTVVIRWKSLPSRTIRLVSLILIRRAKCKSLTN